MNFERGLDPKKQMRIGKSVFFYLKEHSVCRPMNDPTEGINSDKNLRDPDIKVWINPHDQFSFNAEWCSVQDLWDWMNGKGIMVKGKNPEEQKKFWDYACAEVADEHHILWSIRYHFKWFEKMTTDFNPHKHQPYETGHIVTPIKIRPKVKDHLENQKREEEVIIKMLAPFVNEMKKDLDQGREWQYIRKEFEEGYYGVKRTLYCLGIGYMAACNTPEDFCNLAWVNGVVEAKAYYLHLLEKEKRGEVKLPDFEWLSKNSR
jgi:hypothetical protein